MAKRLKKYKSVIIGCGLIAGGYDKPDDKNILTHAHAITAHRKIILSGVYDISYKKACQFARKWNTVPYQSLRVMFDRVEPEIVYICVPDEAHLQVLEKVLDYKPVAVVCEKPLSLDAEKARRIVKRYRKNKVILAINYTRRFYPAVRRLKDNIQKGKYGALINASVIYTKGILHNGSHAVDLLRYFFGEVKSYRVFFRNIDYKRLDPSVDAFLEFGGGIKTHLIAGDERCYSIFETDLLFSRARIRLEQFGMRYGIQNVRKDPVFPGYRDLGNQSSASAGFNKALKGLADNIIRHIENKEDLICSGNDALKTQEACIRLIKCRRKYDR